MSANCGEMVIDEGIMHELAEDGQRGALRGGVGGTQGVTDAEAHAVMLGEDDVHVSGSGFVVLGSRLVELCVAK